MLKPEFFIFWAPITCKFNQNAITCQWMVTAFEIASATATATAFDCRIHRAPCRDKIYNYNAWTNF